jgi:hypothetical protein
MLWITKKRGYGMTAKTKKNISRTWEKELKKLEKKFDLDRYDLVAFIREQTGKSEEEKIIERLVEVIAEAGDEGINFARLKSKACEQFQSRYIEDQRQIVSRMLTTHKSIERVSANIKYPQRTVFRITQHRG